jgi:hypothetical protein
VGEARHNPRSPQYRGAAQNQIGAGLNVELQPNAAFVERLKNVGEAAKAAGVEPLPLQAKDVDLDLVVSVAVHMVIPLQTAIDNRHPVFPIPAMELCRVPFRAFKERVRDKLVAEKMEGLLDRVKLDDLIEVSA